MSEPKVVADKDDAPIQPEAPATAADLKDEDVEAHRFHGAFTPTEDEEDVEGHRFHGA